MAEEIIADDARLARHHAALKKRGASAWLSGPTPDFYFPADDFAAALQLRARVFSPKVTNGARCPCGFFAHCADEYAHHVLGCAKKRYSTVSTRHGAIRDHHASKARGNNITCSIEPPCPEGFTDLTLFHDELDTDGMIIDYTVTSSLSKSGAAEADATTKKKTKYQSVEGLVVAQADAMGGMSNAMLQVIKFICTKGARGAVEVGERVADLKSSTSKMIMKFNGRMLKRAGVCGCTGTQNTIMVQLALQGEEAVAIESSDDSGQVGNNSTMSNEQRAASSGDSIPRSETSREVGSASAASQNKTNNNNKFSFSPPHLFFGQQQSYQGEANNGGLGEVLVQSE